MKRVLIISPYFPPSNAADIHRVRMSLPYFQRNGWLADIVTVHPRHSSQVKDPLLSESIPSDTCIHYVQAFDTKWTGKLGLGSIAIRSLYFFKKKVDALLLTKKFDLIFFSTTQYPVCILGSWWKKKHDIPFIIDMQDPWHSDYYQDKPASQRPPKYWFSYRLNKFLEPLAMKSVDGIMSVSQAYIDVLKLRYSNLVNCPAKVITFGFSEIDFTISSKLDGATSRYLKAGVVNIIYIGRAGIDMEASLKILFSALKSFQTGWNNAEEIHLTFIGTSYAPAGQGKKTVLPIAKAIGVEKHITEITDRIGFYEALSILKNADALVIPGSDDTSYTASKIYPYMFSGRPALGIFKNTSSSFTILRDAGYLVIDIDEPHNAGELFSNLVELSLNYKKQTDITENLKPYSAEFLTVEQTNFFDAVLTKYANT